jgi:hypothetical protein
MTLKKYINEVTPKFIKMCRIAGFYHSNIYIEVTNENTFREE